MKVKIKDAIPKDQRRLLEAAKPRAKYTKLKLKILAHIWSNPGTDAKDIAKAIGREQGVVTSSLLNYASRGYIIRRQLDNRWRYYANNYKLPAVAVAPAQVFHEKLEPEIRFHAQTLEKLAMEWGWDNKSDSLHAFIDWYKENK